MEAPHPLLQPAVVGVHVVDMEIWRLRLRRAGCGQDMELDPGASSEGGDCQCSPKRDPGCASKRDPSEGARGVVPRHPELDPLPHEERRSVVVVRLREGLSTESIGGTRARCAAPSQAAERRAREVPVDPRGQARLTGFCPVRSRRRCFSPRSIVTRSRERSCAGQSRPKPRGGTMASSSVRSRSQIACNASAVALSCRFSARASSQAAY